MGINYGVDNTGREEVHGGLLVENQSGVNQSALSITQKNPLSLILVGKDKDGLDRFVLGQLDLTVYGNLGIDVTPTEKLTILGNILATGTQPSIILRDGLNASVGMRAAGAALEFYATDGLPKVTIDFLGRMGVGLTGPTHSLEVNGDACIYTDLLLGSGTVGDKKIIANNTNVNKPYLVYNDSTDKWEFSNNGLTANPIASNDAPTFTGLVSAPNVTVTGTVVAANFSGPLEGKADTAAKLYTARTISGVSFDGSANITIAKGDIGLGNVDNTSDIDKPISTAQQTAINLKADLAFTTDTSRFGFLNQTETTIAFDGISLFTLAPVGAAWSYYRSGKKCTITGSKTVTITGPVDGTLYYIFIDADNGTLSYSSSPWTLSDTKVLVATILWNNTLTPKYILSDERHSCLIDRRTHYLEHYTEGTKAISVGAISGQVVGTDTNASKTFAIAPSVIADEDLLLSLAALPDPDGTATDYMVMYRTAPTTWVWKQSNMPFVYNAGNTNNLAQYDNNGVMTDATNNRWVNSYLVLTNMVGAARYVMIPGRALFTSLALAQAEAPSSFSFTGFPILEAVIVYQFTWGVANARTSQGKCTLAATPQSVNLSAISTIGSASSIDHNSLAGLQGGAVGDYNHLTGVTLTALTDHLINLSNPHVVTALQVGLGSVNNTADSAKPVSTAQQTALDLKANLAGAAFTGDITTTGTHGITVPVTTGVSGVTFTATAGETLAARDVCYMKSDGKYWKALGTAAATLPGVVVATADITANATGRFMSLGFLYSATAQTVGAQLYVSDSTAGLITETKPTTAGRFVQIAGYAYSANVIYFNPNQMVVGL